MRSGTSDVLNRDTVLFEIVIEHAFGVPFSQVQADNDRLALCEDADLHQMGRQILHDLVRLARGELSSVHIPRRLPRRAEYSEVE